MQRVFLSLRAAVERKMCVKKHVLSEALCAGGAPVTDTLFLLPRTVKHMVRVVC